MAEAPAGKDAAEELDLWAATGGTTTWDGTNSGAAVLLPA